MAETKVITAHVPLALADKVEAMAPGSSVRGAAGCGARRTAALPGSGPAARLGEKLELYTPREVRRIIVGDYEVRDEIADATIFILRLWHSREHRSGDPRDESPTG
jgi:hypothetical protein